MLISELITKLQLVQEADGDREVVVIHEGPANWELVAPELCTHYTDKNDETKYVVSIV